MLKCEDGSKILNNPYLRQTTGGKRQDSLLYNVQNIKSGTLNVTCFKIRLRVQIQLTCCRHHTSIHIWIYLANFENEIVLNWKTVFIVDKKYVTPVSMS